MNSDEGMNDFNTYLVHASQLSDRLVAVALVDQETLTFGRVSHLKRVCRDERVKEGVVFFCGGTFLGAQNATETLSLLTPRSTVRRDLNENIRFGDVKRVVSNLNQIKSNREIRKLILKE